MFLMFELGKPNIFSKGDIALINSVKKNYKMDDLKNSELDKLNQIMVTLQQYSILTPMEVN